jgi:aminoglycoside phosphotransferase (APT) family kinase protein
MNKVLNSIVHKEPIHKGWSEDKKFCVTTADGIKYLLRLSQLAKYESKKKLFSMMEQIAALDIPMCLPVEFGISDNCVYSIQSWINGQDLQTLLPLSGKALLTEAEQYTLGLQAGRIAQRIHSIPIPKPEEEWEVHCNRRMDMVLKDYHLCGLKCDGDQYMVDYMEKNRHLLKDRPQCYLVGDYNVINMMYEKGDLRIIDFERFDIGDPWVECDGIVWSAMASPHFATGQLHGYFDGEPPMEFFRLQAFYIVSLVLSLMSSWAVSSEEGRDVTLKLSRDVLKWFDYMQNPVPTWYLGDIGCNTVIP